MNVQRPIPKKKAVNLSIDEEVLKDSKEAGLNLSKVLEDELRRLRAESWRRENAVAIQKLNDDIETNGIWSDGARPW